MSKVAIEAPTSPIPWFNGDSQKDVSAFIKQISNNLEGGVGIIPFIGAGFSAPSGAPLINELKEYLQRCICLALGLDLLDRTQESVEPWNPRTDRWPPFVDRTRAFDSGAWSDFLFDVIEHLRKDTQKSPAEWNYLAILTEGHGAMQDWRTALLFISRLNRTPRSPVRAASDGKESTAFLPTARSLRASKDVWLETPQQEVVDECFREVLKGKSPTLGHRVLAALAGALRLDLILTTNFDNLLERAFSDTRNPIEVFEVQVGERLPGWTTLSPIRSLVKLHGGRISVRADYSLDESPSQEDKRTFLRYFLSEKGHAQRESGQMTSLDPKCHLLMIGVSGRDRRINELIKYLWEKLDPERFRIYWICYSEKPDVESISELIRSSPCSHRNDATIIRTTHSDLLLLELFQSMRRTLPSLIGVFPSIARVALPPLESPFIEDSIEKMAGANEDFKAFQSDLKGKVHHFHKAGKGLKTGSQGKPSQYKVILAHCDKTISGIVASCAKVFREIEAEPDKECLWIDMNDIASADNLFEVLLEAMYYRLGMEDWIPSTMSRNSDDSVSSIRMYGEIDRLARSVNKRWVVFLNAHETPGVNTSNRQGSVGSGWLDNTEPAKSSDNDRFSDTSSCARDFALLIRSICGMDSRITCVLICRNREVLNNVDPNLAIDPENVPLRLRAPDAKFFKEIDVAKDSMQWANDSPDKRRFLHGLVLLERARHLATIWCPALCPPSEGVAGVRQRSEWIDQLENIGLVRRKPGGMIWVHSATRQILRQAFRVRGIFCDRALADVSDSELFSEIKPDLTDSELFPDYTNLSTEKLQELIESALRSDDEMRSLLHRFSKVGQMINDVREVAKSLDPAPDRREEAELHVALADWYERVLDASGSPAAVFELAIHACKAGQAFVDCGIEDEASARKQIEAASSLLLSNSFLIQTHGYSRGSCRKLVRIAEIGSEIHESVESWEDGVDPGDSPKSSVKKAIRNLWIACVEVMRAVAREVGEDGKAYYRLRQLAWLYAGATWKDLKRDDQARFSELIRDSDMASEAAKKRWHRWKGMLGIASRSYDESEHVFTTLVGDLKAQRSYRHQGSSMRQPLTDNRLNIELLRSIEQATELQLLRYSAAVRAKSVGKVSAVSDPIELLDSAEALIDRGCRLAKRVRSWQGGNDIPMIAEANWTETRLLMHRSIVVARKQHPETGNGSVIEPMGILGDAEAKLRMSDARRIRSELALIDLHRADVRMTEAEAIVFRGPRGRCCRFSDLAEGQSGFKTKEDIEEYRIFVKKQDRKKEGEERAKLRTASALLQDAIRFLNRAEPVLHERRRNVWWTTWFFERKLRAIGLVVALSTIDPGLTIPFFGLESAIRASDSEADRLLADGLRMIRVDSYRVATLLFAYVRCLSALQRLIAVSDGSDDVLPRRRGEMLVKVHSALETLEQVHNRRKDPKVPPHSATKAVAHPDVLAYVTGVREKVHEFLMESESEALKFRHTKERLLAHFADDHATNPMSAAKANAQVLARNSLDQLTKDAVPAEAIKRLRTSELPPEWIDDYVKRKKRESEVALALGTST